MPLKHANKQTIVINPAEFQNINEHLELAVYISATFVTFAIYICYIRHTYYFSVLFFVNIFLNLLSHHNPSRIRFPF